MGAGIMDFYNATGTIGQIIGNANTTVTGSLIVTLMIIFILVIAMAIMFGIPLEYTAIIVFPLALAYASYYKEFLGPLAIIIFYLAILFTKSFIFK
jgi:hypothetical protein